jgi:hypothetical protein
MKRCGDKARGAPAFFDPDVVARSECNAYRDTMRCLEQKAQEHAGTPGCTSFLAEWRMRMTSRRDLFCEQPAGRKTSLPVEPYRGPRDAPGN